MSKSYTSAQAVSRKLKSEGITCVPRTREGVHVTRSLFGAAVTVDLDSPSERRVIKLYIKEILTAAGYEVTGSEDSNILFVHKPGNYR